MEDDSTAIARKTVTMQVTERLREMILSGELASGERLLQEKLALRLGVSRVPVREALKQLEAEGLISVETHKGAVVSGVTIEALNEMYELRAELEYWLIGLAIPNLTEADYAEAERILVDMRSNAVQRHWTAQNWAFHSLLYRPANRPQTLEILERLYMNTYRHFPVPMRFTIGIEAMDQEHRYLVGLCRSRKIAEAQVFLQKHIMDGARSLLERMQSPHVQVDQPNLPAPQVPVMLTDD